MSMSRKDFEAIAKAIKTSKTKTKVATENDHDQAVAELAIAIVQAHIVVACKDANASFNAAKFNEACR